MKWNFQQCLDYATDLLGTIIVLVVVYWALWYCQKEMVEQSTQWILHQANAVHETTCETVGSFFGQ